MCGLADGLGGSCMSGHDELVFGLWMCAGYLLVMMDLFVLFIGAMSWGLTAQA